jgi:hypothetical protein
MESLLFSIKKTPGVPGADAIAKYYLTYATLNATNPDLRKGSGDGFEG